MTIIMNPYLISQYLFYSKVLCRSHLKTGISNAMAGTEDDLLGMGSDEEDNFDGFPDDVVEDSEQYAANVASAIDNTTLSED